MAFPKALTTRYFQLINNRQFTEAQRELQRIKQKIPKTEWNHGYYRALFGMHLAQKHNGSQYAFLQNLKLDDKAALKQHKQEFQTHIQSRFHDDFDRGYFSAWHDYARLIIKTIPDVKPKPDLEGQTSITHYAEASKEPESH